MFLTLSLSLSLSLPPAGGEGVRATKADCRRRETETDDP